MSLLDDARRLASESPFQSIKEDCLYCDSGLGHAPDCPWLSMGRIVAALEAAERIAAMIPITLLDHHDCPGQEVEFCSMAARAHHVWFCAGCDESVHCDCGDHERGRLNAHDRAFDRLVHDGDCPLGALVAALKGDVVP